MRIYNFLPLLLDCLEKWETPPAREVFHSEYLTPIQNELHLNFPHHRIDLHTTLLNLDWNSYRTQTLLLNPVDQEAKLRSLIQKTENLFGISLVGDILLFGGFRMIDGYAQFNQGSHLVFLGLDIHQESSYSLEIMMAHELGHVARESRSEVWESWGLNPKMTNPEFVQNQPVIEHLLGEGLSCLVSELLVPGARPRDYVFQTELGFVKILENKGLINSVIQEALGDPQYGYRGLYNLDLYQNLIPPFGHYYWAWQWTRTIFADQFHSNPKEILNTSSKLMLSHGQKYKI